MLPFLLRRLGSAAITLALATGVVFIAIHLLPGDPVAIMLGDQAGSDPVAVARVRAQLGLDLPLGTQFTHWAGALARGDLGFRCAPANRWPTNWRGAFRAAWS
ncbi:hypothetical protein WJ971_20875 [Achromobacter xylosoxidans]